MPIRNLLRLAALAPALLLWGCRALRNGGALPCTIPPSWSRGANIYELNLRQFTPAGTLEAASAHLPRLMDLGVDIIWLMPIHPIGEDRRKGTLGSYYSVRDYRAVNPEFGTLQDLQSFVRQAHDLQMRVILDWVANHCAWDNALVSAHPDWVTRDETGNMVAPVSDWSDVVDLNYDVPDLRRYMIDSLLFWVKETDIDGYRCDVAEMVPIDFWRTAREELEAEKALFMLAEGSKPHLHDRAFDMTYDWDLFDMINDIAAGRATLRRIDRWLASERKSYAEGAYRMCFTSNHDENSWKGAAPERLGEGIEAFAVLAATIGGMPLIYGGQEAGLDRRLAFFDRDPIAWREHSMASLYRRLLHLKRSEPALWNGNHGARAKRIKTTARDQVFAFDRRNEGSGVRVVLNLSPKPAIASVAHHLPGAEMTDAFTGAEVDEAARTRVELAPWDYRIWLID